jgi:branched-chain amino acid transport system permease protein
VSDIAARPAPQAEPEVSRWRRETANFLSGHRLPLLLPLVGAILLIVFPYYNGSVYWMREISLILVLTMVVSGVNLSFGYAGEVQFSQVFIFGLASYVTMILAIHGFNDIIALLILGAVVALIAGTVIALPALRVGGWSLAIASFFLVITIPNFADIAAKYTGGDNGLVGIPQPTLFHLVLGNVGLFEASAVAALVWLAIYRNLVTSRYGIAFRVMRHSPILSQSLGYSTYRLKTLAYAIGGVPAGAAGCLFGYISLVIAPTSFGLTLAVGIVAASVLGGVESIYGAVLGAALLQLGPEKSLSFANYAPVAFGLFLVVAAVLLPKGLGGLALRLLDRVSRSLAPLADRRRIGVAMADAEPSDVLPHRHRSLAEHNEAGAGDLMIRGVSKSYGGIEALKDVSLDARAGQVTALIGSNGSGKTTLLNVICGYVRPTKGSVEIGGRTLSGAPYQIARSGVARTFQTPAMPRGVSVLDTVAAGSNLVETSGVFSSVLRLPRYRRARRDALIKAHAYLNLMQLGHLANEDASSLSLGTRRLVEVARALSGEPTLLLLDEPASGLATEEVARLHDIVRLAATDGVTVVLIEHNFGFVAEVSDTVHVLHLGELIASGPATVIAHDERVIESYLGVSSKPTAGAVPTARSELRIVPPDALAVAGPSEVAGRSEVPRLTLRGAESGYGDLKVLHGVDLELYEGHVEVVLGRNGVGKTTLLNTISGQNRLWSGHLELVGRDITRRGTYRRAQDGISLVQEGKRIFAARTVWQNLMLGTYGLRISRHERTELCNGLLETFPVLRSRVKDRAGSLSGGQQQMLAIAQALAARPLVLMLDEPSAGLAPAILDDLFARIRALADGGLAVVVVEQLAEQALDIADHVTVLLAGEVVASGPPDDFADRRSLQAAYFGVAQ